MTTKHTTQSTAPRQPSPPVAFAPGTEPHICRIGSDLEESARAAAALQRIRKAMEATNG